MTILFNLNFPWKEPVFVFALILIIILVMPLLMKKIKVPGIVGLIIAGFAIGPKGGGVIELETIRLFSTIGLLYIMFLAGLEIDFRDFQKNRNKSILYGALVFTIPFILGILSSLYILHFSWLSALLMASMYTTHTLISYPIVSRLGVTKNEAVTVTVGGTIVTDTAALLFLSFITSMVKGAEASTVLLKMGVAFAIFLILVMGVFSRIARWFFKNVESEGTSQFIFSLFIVFISAVTAELAGIEAIIGAFLAGLTLNRLIPHSSVLMNRVNFTGNAIFIPIFLISVGMRLDMSVLVSDWSTWKVIILMLTVAITGKWLAAFIGQKIFKYSIIERNLMFSLSVSKAAVALAVVLTGFELKLFDVSILNGTIVVILVTCLISTFISENAAKKLAIKELEKMGKDTEGVERILVPIANPANFEQLIDLAILIKNPQSDEPIYPLSVVNDDAESKKRILINDKLFSNAITHARAAEVKVEVVSRVDLNVAGGIVRAAKDLAISDVIIGWNGKANAVDFFFGNIMSQLLQNSPQTVMVSKILQPINTFWCIHVVVPPNAELETGFNHWLLKLIRLTGQLGSRLVFYAVENGSKNLRQILKKNKLPQADYKNLEDWDAFENLSTTLAGNDLLLIVSARPHTLSYSKYMERLPRVLSDKFENTSFVILFPEQAADTEGVGVSGQFIT